MARGIERRPLFVDDCDRSDMLERLREVVPDAGAAFYAWTFMPNHIHFVVRSGHESVSRWMRRLNTGFATRFNLRHDRVGHLFQNRFRSRLVTGDADLQNLIRYVHLNPIEAGILRDLDSLEDWPWSGHAALMGRREPLRFEDALSPLRLFGLEACAARTSLRRWMEDPRTEESRADDDERTTAVRPTEERADELERLIERACRYYGTTSMDLLRGGRARHESSARALICYVAVHELRMTHERVAARVGVSAVAVCKALPRGASLARGDLARIGIPREAT